MIPCHLTGGVKTLPEPGTVASTGDTMAEKEVLAAETLPSQSSRLQTIA